MGIAGEIYTRQPCVLARIQSGIIKLFFVSFSFSFSKSGFSFNKIEERVLSSKAEVVKWQERRIRSEKEDVMPPGGLLGNTQLENLVR